MNWRLTIRSTLFALLTFLAFSAVGQKNPEIYKGNELYRKQQYDKAVVEYEKALSKDKTNPTANFNEGNALFRQNKFEDAAKTFDNAIVNASDKNVQQQSFYNKGVSMIKQQKLEESIQSWKEALKLNPNDKETRDNLEKALRELRKKQEQEKQQKKEQKKDKKEQEKEQPKKQQSKLSQQRVEQLLKALQQKEKEVNAKLNQQKVASVSRPEKDW